MNETAGMISFREKAILFYKRLEYLIRPLFRFAVALALLLLLRRHLGAYGPANAMLQNTLLNVIIALACSMVPPGYAAAIVALVMVWDLYALSLEAAAICAALLLLCILLYFRFSPRDTIVMLLMPIAYACNLHFAVPVLAGLLYGPGAAVPVVFGLLFTKYVLMVEGSLPSITSGGGPAAGEQLIANFRGLIDGMMHDRGMIILAAALAVTVLVVCFFRHLILAHAWTIAIAAGCVTELVILLAGDMRFDAGIDLGRVLIGIVLAFGVGQLVRIFVFNVDYLHIENVQFEDEDYYYYVKAVPKVITPLSLPSYEGDSRFPDEFAPGADPEDTSRR